MKEHPEIARDGIRLRQFAWDEACRAVGLHEPHLVLDRIEPAHRDETRLPPAAVRRAHEVDIAHAVPPDVVEEDALNASEQQPDAPARLHELRRDFGHAHTRESDIGRELPARTLDPETEVEEAPAPDLPVCGPPEPAVPNFFRKCVPDARAGGIYSRICMDIHEHSRTGVILL